jgi:hypothetical protein
VKSETIIIVLVIANVAWGTGAWYKKHRAEEELEAARQAQTLARTERAKAALVHLENVWNADGSWEDEITSPTGDRPSYSMEVEHALVKGHPVIVIGTIQDVETGGGQGDSVIEIENHFGAHEAKLRFSLTASPEVATSILSATHNDALADVKTFICVASIEHVDKVEPPVDKGGDEQGYFLAHGTLHEAYSTQLFERTPKDLGASK